MAEDRDPDQEGKTPEPAGLDPGAVAIPAADGYHYGDNPTHQWNEDRQKELASALRKCEGLPEPAADRRDEHGQRGGAAQPAPRHETPPGSSPGAAENQDLDGEARPVRSMS